MRLIMYLILMIFINYSFAASNDAQKSIHSVYSKSNNIYYMRTDGREIQLTHLGKDSLPILSPDKTMIAFIRTGDTIIPDGCDDFADTATKFGNQIWIYYITNKETRLLVTNNFSCDTPEKQIIDSNHLQFSPDSKTLYFITSAWVTSGALHIVNVDGTNQHYLMPANSLEIINKGEYKGYLIIGQHRYFIGGGSYDWLWLFSPQGKEEGPLGEDMSESQREIIEAT